VTESNAVEAGIEEVADRYIAVWNEPDAEGRRHAVARLWTEDGTYTDPLAAAEGREAIEGVITGVREQFPGTASGGSATPMPTTTSSGFAGGWCPREAMSRWWKASTWRSSPTLGEYVPSTASSTRFPHPDALYPNL